MAPASTPTKYLLEPQQPVSLSLRSSLSYSFIHFQLALCCDPRPFFFLPFNTVIKGFMCFPLELSKAAVMNI